MRLPSGTVVHSWPTTGAVGTVVLQHGFGEYAERYLDTLIPALLDARFSVHALDLWGHGASPGRRGQVHVGRAVDDHLALRASLSDTSLLLLGHSLGGLVTAASAATRQDGIAGVVLLSPALPPRESRGLLGTLARVAPHLPVPRKRRPVEELSRSPEVVARAGSDPGMYAGQVSLLTAATAMDETTRVWQALPSWQVPLLALHGTADTYTDPTRTEELITRAGATDKTLHLIEEGRHELHQDLSAAQVLSHVLDWLNTHREAAP